MDNDRRFVEHANIDCVSLEPPKLFSIRTSNSVPSRTFVKRMILNDVDCKEHLNTAGEWISHRSWMHCPNCDFRRPSYVWTTAVGNHGPYAVQCSHCKLLADRGFCLYVTRAFPELQEVRKDISIEDLYALQAIGLHVEQKNRDTFNLGFAARKTCSVVQAIWLESPCKRRAAFRAGSARFPVHNRERRYIHVICGNPPQGLRCQPP